MILEFPCLFGFGHWSYKSLFFTQIGFNLWISFNFAPNLT